MDDLISRQAAIDVVETITWYHQNRNNEMVSGANSELHQAWYKADDVYAALNNVPTAEPTLYGYEIKHLAYIATVMEKEGVTAEYAVRTFDDMERVLKMYIEEVHEKIEESFNNHG